MAFSLESVLGQVFTVYAAFWIVVVVGLYLSVGALLKKRDRVAAERRRSESEAHH